MKILIAIAILLNVYGVLASPHIFNSPPEFEERAHNNPHPRHKHRPNHHHHHHDNEVNELTVDDLADVLISLPGSLGTQAYKTFLMLGKFLPADTKAHKFFTSIPKSIRRKSKSEISHLRAVPQVQSSMNPIFMMQPAGYHMMPLPLHPMFSSSPLDYLTRVPCRHTKLIRVPLHTFDVQISATTRRFQPAQNAFDDSDASDYDNDNEDDDGGAYIKDLLDLLASDDEDDEIQLPEPSENKGSEETVEPESNTPVSKETESTPENEAKPEEKTEEPKPEIVEEEPAKILEEETPSVQDADKKPSNDEESSPEPEESSPVEEPSAPALPTIENQPAAAEIVSPPKEEDASAEQQVAEPKEVESQDPVESTPVNDTPAKKNKKKKEPKKGKKSATELEPEAAEVQEPQIAPAADEDENSIDEVATPIQPKRGKKKRVKGKN